MRTPSRNNRGAVARWAPSALLITTETPPESDFRFPLGPGYVAIMILDDFRLTDVRAVVTGGGKGIGRGIALCLAEAGADVLVSARSTDQIDAVAAEITGLGRQGFAHATDVTAPGALEELGKVAADKLGGIDLWVNNAGGLPDATPRYLTRTPEDRWDAQINLNLKAVWQGCVVAAEHIGASTRASDRFGSIVNISSETGTGAHPKNGPYAASKAAVNSLTRTLSMELAPAVRVNAVSPGPVLTDNFIESVGYEGERKAAIDKGMQIPLGRIGNDRDIAAAVVFLASPAANWITGQIFSVNGGRG